MYHFLVIEDSTFGKTLVSGMTKFDGTVEIKPNERLVSLKMTHLNIHKNTSLRATNLFPLPRTAQTFSRLILVFSLDCGVSGFRIGFEDAQGRADT